MLNPRQVSALLKSDEPRKVLDGRTLGSPTPEPRGSIQQHKWPWCPAHPLSQLFSEIQYDEGGERICFLSRTWPTEWKNQSMERDENKVQLHSASCRMRETENISAFKNQVWGPCNSIWESQPVIKNSLWPYTVASYWRETVVERWGGGGRKGSRNRGGRKKQT